MGTEIVNGSWFSALRLFTRKGIASDDNEAIGILASEICGMMLKVVNLWHSLSDSEIMSLREGMVNSVGVKMLVSDDDDFLMELALDEIIHNFVCLARCVARLGKRCKDPVYHRYEHFVNNPAQNCDQWSGWEYRLQKMERKVKKMERFAAAMSQFSQELEVLAEREQTLRRMQANPEKNRVKLLEFQKKVMWHRQEVKNLRDLSPWNRSYDYIVRLLARSLFTILERIIIVFRNKHVQFEQQPNGSPNFNPILRRTYSFSSLAHSSVHPSENVHPSCFVAGKIKKKKKLQQDQHLPALGGKHQHSESKQLKHITPFNRFGCMSTGNDSPVMHNCVVTNSGSTSLRLNDHHLKIIDKRKTMDKLFDSYRSRIYSKLSIKCRLRPPQMTLGDAALALHYANVIILIERIMAAPNLIDLQTRDDLYNMLPTSISTPLRANIKRYARNKGSSACDENLTAEWNLVLTQTLEWLAPLAHNMVRWHSERNFEKDHTTSKANVLLVQTLYYANQAETEAAIIELLVGLNYVCKIDRKAGIRDTPEFAGSRSYTGAYFRKNEVFNDYI